MWVLYKASTGMLSACKRRCPSHLLFVEEWHLKGMLSLLLVRARSPFHIREMFPYAAVDETPNADYPFRTVIERELFANVMLDYSLNIDYDNFKNSIKENNFHDHCVQVWAIMMRYGLNWGSFE